MNLNFRVAVAAFLSFLACGSISLAAEKPVRVDAFVVLPPGDSQEFVSLSSAVLKHGREKGLEIQGKFSIAGDWKLLIGEQVAVPDSHQRFRILLPREGDRSEWPVAAIDDAGRTHQATLRVVFSSPSRPIAESAAEAIIPTIARRVGVRISSLSYSDNWVTSASEMVVGLSAGADYFARSPKLFLSGELELGLVPLGGTPISTTNYTISTYPVSLPLNGSTTFARFLSGSANLRKRIWIRSFSIDLGPGAYYETLLSSSVFGYQDASGPYFDLRLEENFGAFHSIGAEFAVGAVSTGFFQLASPDSHRIWAGLRYLLRNRWLVQLQWVTLALNTNGLNANSTSFRGGVSYVW